VKSWGCTFSPYNVNCLYGICTSVRTNVFLRSNSNYKFSLCRPIYRNDYSSMTLGRIFSRQSYSYPILCLPFSFPLYNCSSSYYPPSVSPQKWSKKPHRDKKELRQVSLPHILHHQGHSRLYCFNLNIIHLGILISRSIKRPRKLYSS